MSKKKVVVNFGHGGPDSGAVGNGLKEKDLTKAIGKRITKLLRDNYDVEVKEIRQSQSSGGLTQITNEANAWGADIFVSIHINSGGGTGFESFIFNGNVSNDTQKLQNAIHNAVVKEINVTDRGKKKANFAVLRQTKMPAVLTENMFIDTKSDADKLKDSKFLDKVAQGHANGIANFLGLKSGGNSKPSKPSKPATDHTKPTKKKATGPIATIQDTLNKRYNTNIAVDNLTGPATRKALIIGLQTELNTQFNAGLSVDGLWGPKTRNAVVNVYSGARGNLTWILQAMLVTRGYNVGDSGVDGIFGKDTVKAVKSFQRKNKLSADGIAGKATFAKLK